MSATAQVVDGKMEPMQGVSGKPQVHVTGQWIFDNFVGGEASVEQISRMNMVRLLAEQATDAELKVALKDAVEIAHKYDIKAGIPEKERGPKRAQAMNARSVMQNAYGALRRAKEELIKLGYNDKTGYQEMRVLSQQALKAHGIKWNGTQIPTDETKALADIQREKQAKRDAMAEAMTENLQADGEEDTQYLLRVSKIAQAVLAANKVEAQKRVASKVVNDLVTKHGRDIASLVVERLTALLAQTSEMTDEQAEAALQEAAQAEADESEVDEALQHAA